MTIEILKRKFEYYPEPGPEKKQKTKETREIRFNEIQKDFIELQNKDYSDISMEISSKEAIEEDPKWVDLQEIHEELFSKFGPQDTFKERIEQFTCYLEGAKGIYINLDDKCIYLEILKTDQFTSEALPKELFSEDGSSYVDIKVHESFEENGEYIDEDILTIRCSENGLLNELVKIEKGKTITGTEGMKIFEEKIVPWFNLKRVFLYDDAKKIDPIPIPLRKNGIFLRDGSSWYERQKYSLYNCENVIVLGEIPLNQSQEAYQASKNTLCSLPLNDFRKYLEPSTAKKIKTSLKNPTLKEYVETLNAKKRDKDLSFFLVDCLDPTKTRGLHDLKVIEDARIYVKDFSL